MQEHGGATSMVSKRRRRPSPKTVETIMGFVNEDPVATVVQPGRLTWPERIDNYRREIGIPYLGHENGWTYGTWFMGNSYEKKTDYYGGFQGNFLKRISALFPDRQRVLHLFAGKVDLGISNPPGAVMPRPATVCQFISMTLCWLTRPTARAMPSATARSW